MGKKTIEEIKQMCDLYKQLNNFSAVARQLSVSASTVSKYVKLQQEEEKEQQAIEQLDETIFNGFIKDIKDIPKPKSQEAWKMILEWAPEEWDEFREEGIA